MHLYTYTHIHHVDGQVELGREEAGQFYSRVLIFALFTFSPISVDPCELPRLYAHFHFASGLVVFSSSSSSRPVVRLAPYLVRPCCLVVSRVVVSTRPGWRCSVSKRHQSRALASHSLCVGREGQEWPRNREGIRYLGRLGLPSRSLLSLSSEVHRREAAGKQAGR